MILPSLYQGIFCKIKNLTSRDTKIFLEIDKIFKNIRQSTIIQANPIRKYKPVPEKKEWRPKYVQTPGPKRKRAQEKTETERIGSFLVYLWIKSQKLVILRKSKGTFESETGQKCNSVSWSWDSFIKKVQFNKKSELHTKK